jgi:hypothetical protein
MSYSFTVHAHDKASAKTMIADELKQIVAKQGVHSADFEQAGAAADAFVDLLDDDDTRDVTAKVSGTLKTHVKEGKHIVRGCTLSVEVAAVSRAKEPPEDDT